MKGYYRHILAATAVLLMIAACTKQPAHNERKTDEITIQVSAPVTKAMFSDEYFQKEGNRIKIYDFNPSGKYFDDLIGPDVQGNTYGYEGVWPFENAPHAWTVDEHKFFGWLANDANFEGGMTPESFFGTGFKFDEGTKILTIPAKSMGVNTPQFDFLYSNIETRDMVNAADYSAVKLNFSHLFTAVSFGAENSTTSDIQIKEFRIEKILNKRSATINYSGTEPVITYIDGTSDQYLTRSSGEFTLASETHINDIFNNSDNQSFLLLWPLKASHLFSDATAKEENGVVNYPEEWKMYIKYITDGAEYTKRMNFPNVAWEAGKRYHYDILFADKTIELTVHVKDWDYEHQDVDYTDASVGVESTGVLKWDSAVSEINEANKTVSIVNAQPAKGSFTIKAPVGGTWMISLTGDVNAFEVTPDNGEIDGNTAHISVKPLISDPKRDYKVKLKFAVRRADGRVITADEVQPTVYTIVLPQNN